MVDHQHVLLGTGWLEFQAKLFPHSREYRWRRIRWQHGFRRPRGGTHVEINYSHAVAAAEARLINDARPAGHDTEHLREVGHARFALQPIPYRGWSGSNHSKRAW